MMAASFADRRVCFPVNRIGRHFNRLPVLLLAAVFAVTPLCACSSEASREPLPIAGGSCANSAFDGDSPASCDESEDAQPTLGSGRESTIDVAAIPAYDGSPYTVVEDNVPGFSETDLSAPEEQYAPLDSLGRCGTAFAIVSRATMPTEERGSIGMIKPTGWHTVRYDDLIADRYLYNRCHLIGYQLTAENANEENLITGTRYMNVEGMLLFENEVADYVERTGNRVLYRVTPVFVDDELVARGVQMEACSVEDDGAGVCFNVFCYNVQPGIGIDYATGDSWRMSDGVPAYTPEDGDTQADGAAGQADVPQSAPVEVTYILNVNTGKFHLPGCRSVKQMKDKNKREVMSTREDMIAQGYSPCANCNP